MTVLSTSDPTASSQAPATATLPTIGGAQPSSTTGNPRLIKDFKVKISVGNESVIFEASSPIGESRTATYQGFDLVHAPTDIWAYKNTSARRFSITGKLVSRSPNEADTNSYYLNLIRKWMMPEFGGTGATPPICLLSGYGNINLNNVQVVLLSYAFTFPDDVDYIFTNAEPMPVIGLLQIDAVEAYSGEQITNGDWKIKPGAQPQPFLGSSNLINFQSTTTKSTSLNIQNLASNSKYKFPGLASGILGIPGLPSIGSILNNTIGSVLNGSIFKNPVAAIGVTSSTLISAPTSQISKLSTNPFIVGGGDVIQTPNVVVPTVPVPLSDSFGRAAPLPSPVIINNNIG